MIKIIRTSTVPISLNILLKGQLKFLSQSFTIIGVSGSGQDLDEVKDREGVKTVSVEMQRGISPIKDLISLYKLYLLFRNEKPQIVHSITPKAGLLTMLAGKMAGIPIRMHTFTGLIFPTKKGLIQKLLIKMDQLLCWSATDIYPEGKGVKEDLIKYKITSKPLKILANGNVNGIDLDFFSKKEINNTEQNKLRNELGIHNDDFVFIFVGRLVKDKGINELVEAFSNINKLNIKLLLVGPLESELDPLLPQTITEIKNNQNIISTGFQKDVRPYLSLANVFVFPSYREGFPNVVMQAGAMELPSIVSNINGCNEIIVEGVNGTIIPVKNSNEILKSMLKILTNKEYCDTLKSNARPMIESRYEQPVVWNALLNEYELLIGKL
ncbi:MAG: glycosyltransferase family 4 protein [Chryseobacterium jejuense]|uniref:glycosyltransferase family 4 protein n=1 Tax=Chryseobacterium jejuense TaxID=445960 RepID=UPI003D10CD4A